MSEERSWTANQLLTDFASEIASGVVEVLEDLPSAHAPLAGFPRLDLRLDFDQMPGSERLDGSQVNLLLGPDSPFDDFWARKRKEHGIGDDAPVVVVGDTLELALQMPAGVYTRRLRDILDFTMHWFVYPPDGAWCFSLVMTGDAFFGLRPEVLPPSWAETTLLADTESLRQEGRVQVQQRSILDLLRPQFPLDGQRIDWARLDDSTVLRPPKRRGGFTVAPGELEAMDVLLVDFWRQAQRSADISESQHLFVGGPQVPFTLRLSTHDLVTLLPDILSTLNETHILQPKPAWCCSFRAEGDVIFGGSRR